ncbi:25070_t:CDS:2 [Gigaspora margarita]|uniref:25070_t:CDS:1 n=1 Tax=Gigaspora margarita TaxID=4874 RepID=A0ABN7UY13_GIGMA|nr:25070_t:CDS:2 [Gigaspora margarita]
MAVTTQFLVTGMLISGVCNTILNKLQDMQCVSNCDDPDPSKHEYFEQPVWQTLNMFIGETMCFVVAYILLYWERYQEKGNRETTYEPLEVEATLTNDSETVTVVEDESDGSPIKIDEYRGPTEEMSGWRVIWFWLPTICDIMGTTFMNVGLIYTSASVYQMLRGAVVLFTGTFSVLFLRRRLYPYHWFSLFLVVLGVSIVGMSSILFPPVKPVAPVDTTPPVEVTDGSVEAMIGVFFVIFAQIFTASQFVIEEQIMEKYRVKPVLAVGLEGLFGLSTVTVGMFILYFLFGKAHPGGYFDISVGFNQIISYRQIWIAGISICFSIAFFNFFGLSVTRTLSATARSTIDTSRIVLVWLVSLFLGWEIFSWLQVFGFIVLIAGTFIFNDVIRPPPCFTVPPKETSENQPLLPEDHEHI